MLKKIQNYLNTLHLSRNVFYLIIFLLPLNLGKHFELVDSYAWGVLVDYLVPTVFVQDMLVVALVLLWMLEGNFTLSAFDRLFKKPVPRYFIYFIFCVFLSVFVATRFIPSIYAFGRLFLYVLFCFYIIVNLSYAKEFYKTLTILEVSFIFICVLGIVQFIKQGSVFDNYLMFGEQPYSQSTFGIAREFVFNQIRVGSYGLFRHPNVFGGILALLLILVMPKVSKTPVDYVFFCIGLVTLVLTLSFSSYAAVLLAVLLYSKWSKINIYVLSVVFSVSMLFIPLIPVQNLKLGWLFEPTSISRRALLLNIGFELIQKNFMFGVGYNMFTLNEGLIFIENGTRFTQPVHNVFILVLAESGVLALLFFYLVIFRSLANMRKYFDMTNQMFNRDSLICAFAVLIFLFGFDHYFITSHQGMLFLMLLLGFANAE